MVRVCSFPQRRKAFTLIELLVVIAIIGILAAFAFPVYNSMIVKGRQTQTLNNMRAVGLAFTLYTGDNNNELPGRSSGNNTDGTPVDKWPKVLSPYAQNLLVYNAPIPGYVGTQYQTTDPIKIISNTTNYTSYIANGYNDLGAYGDPTIKPRTNLITQPSQVILLGVPFPGKNNFYMDFVEHNETAVLNKTPWPQGSIYTFCDGSSRFLKYRSSDNMAVAPKTSDYYSDWLWLMDKSHSTTP